MPKGSEKQKEGVKMGYKIKQLRKERNMTQLELARASGVSRATIITLESGQEVVVKSATLKAIAAALKCSVPDLFATNV